MNLGSESHESKQGGDGSAADDPKTDGSQGAVAFEEPATDAVELNIDDDVLIDGVAEVSRTTDDQAATAEELTATIEHLRDRADETAEAADRIVGAADEADDAVDELQRSVAELKAEGRE